MEMYNKYFLSFYPVADNASPDLILKSIGDYFKIMSAQYLRGLITEKEFYIYTSFNADFLYFWPRKDFKLDYGAFLDKGFIESCKEWKNSGHLTAKRWMYNYIKGTEDYVKAANWIIKVIDVLKIPLACFEPVFKEKEPSFVTPNVIFANGESTNGKHYCRWTLTEKCIDINKLLECSNPINVSFDLTTNYYKKVSITIDHWNEIENSYIGTGTIENFVLRPQRIYISNNILDYWTFSCEREIDPFQHALVVGDLIPHPAWNEYNEAVLARNLKIEYEYKMLRIPYMLPQNNSSLEYAAHKNIEANNKIIQGFFK